MNLVLGSGFAFTHTSKPLPIFLLVQNGSLFSAGSSEEGYGKLQWMLA